MVVAQEPGSEVGSHRNTNTRRRKMYVIAVHEWKPEEQITITKEMIVGFNELIAGTSPKGIELCYTWARHDIGAFCLWNVPSVDTLEKFFKTFGPTMLKTTKFYPVTQVYPGTIEYELALMQMIVDMAK
jgi:hypothetical protein